MTLTAGLNGFGRFGLHLLRYWLDRREKADFRIVALNDPLLTLEKVAGILRIFPGAAASISSSRPPADTPGGMDAAHSSRTRPVRSSSRRRRRAPTRPSSTASTTRNGTRPGLPARSLRHRELRQPVLRPRLLRQPEARADRSRRRDRERRGSASHSRDERKHCSASSMRPACRSCRPARRHWPAIPLE